MNILQNLYDSEINFSVSTFWDGGFDVKLGDDMNGFKEKGNVLNFLEAQIWLMAKAIEHYPESTFAKNCRAQANKNDSSNCRDDI